MTFLTRSFASLRPASRYLSRPAATFHTSAPRLAFSENDRDAHKDQPNRDQKIESHKQDSVSKAKQGDGEWKPELASSSEQIAAADKSNKSMDQMQKEGAQKAEQGKNPSGSS